MSIPDSLHLGPILMLSIVVIGCPTEETGDSPDDPIPPYPFGDSLGWPAIPGSPDLAMERISLWLDTPNVLAEPIEGAGDCSLVRTEYDPADGPASYRNTMSYEQRGYLLRRDNDSEADGTVDSWHQYTYDDDGLAVLYQAGHASPDPDEVVRWEYDGEGRMVLEEHDWGDDGTVESSRSWSYDGGGHLVASIYHEDFENEGEYTGTTTYTWVADRVTGVEYRGESEDWGNSHVRVHLQAEDGLPSRYDSDEDADGILDSVIGYSWDGPDRLLVQWLDRDADGVIEERYELLYDGSDLPYHIDVMTTEPDESLGGMDFLWNAEGQFLDFQGYDLPQYGENGQHIIQEYDEAGRLTYYCEDDLTVECDDNQRSFTYDGDLIALEEIWIGGDEQQDERVEYEWSCP